MKYDAVIFDLFGTLVDNATQEVAHRSYLEPAAVLGVDVEKFVEVWLGIRPEKDVGRYGSLKGDIRHAGELLGLQPDAEQVERIAQQRLHIYRTSSVPRATVSDTMSKLKADGLKIGLITDCGWEIPAIYADFPFAPLVDTALFSCCEGVVKPDPRLYKAVCDRLDVQPSRCLYVGDGGSRELTGARTAGMQPVLIRVDYERHLDVNRPDAVEWTGPVISDISEVLGIVGLPAQ